MITPTSTVAAVALLAGMVPFRTLADDAPTRLGVAVQPPSVADQTPRDLPGLHNVVAFHDGYYSGSVPDGRVGFDTLVAIGVRTIISVDGAIPDVEQAKVRGLRYIHLPIGYNGFDEERKLQLARATRDAMKNGSVYIHCHHGKHRSAAAAGAVAASLGWSPAEDMVARMKVSGTSPNYKGLFTCTAESRLIPSDALDRATADFPEVSRPAGFVKSMVEIDAVHDHLKSIEQAGWGVPTNHPDLVPAAEAERMAELFRALSEDDRTKREPPDFAKLLDDARAEARTLVTLLNSRPRDSESVSRQFIRLHNTCLDCHARFRD